MTDTPIFYHRRPSDLRGPVLLPLNILRSVHPDLYEMQASKYRGREVIPDRLLPELDCRWGDCVQFSTVHPAEIRAAMIETGHDWPKQGVRFLAIRADRAEFTSADTAIWLYEDAGPTKDLAAIKSDVVPYASNTAITLSALHHRTKVYLREMREAGRRPLLFVGVHHVLHRGTVAIEHVDEIII